MPMCVHLDMDYLDVLRREGWIADPTDKVRVAVVHDGGCPAAKGRSCWCTPRLVLTAASSHSDEHRFDGASSGLEIASGE
jgi:hypothetical protein